MYEDPSTGATGGTASIVDSQTRKVLNNEERDNDTSGYDTPHNHTALGRGDGYYYTDDDYNTGSWSYADTSHKSGSKKTLLNSIWGWTNGGANWIVKNAGHINAIATGVTAAAAVFSGACMVASFGFCTPVAVAVMGVAFWAGLAVTTVTQGIETEEACTHGSGWDCADNSLYLGADLLGVVGTSAVLGKLPGMKSAPIEPLISNLRKIVGGG